MRRPIPIVDLFAGPGGLGEGFSSVKNGNKDPVFDIGVSVEKDVFAHATLALRSLVRKIETPAAWEVYLNFMQKLIPAPCFLAHREISQAAILAQEEARCAELGKTDPALIDGWISDAIGNRTDWVLIGGPPCQAYSMAGRSRRTNDKDFENDEKHFLYREYLRIIRKFEPAVFVMENVKGMLSSKHDGSPIFDRILEDLSRPEKNLDYEIRSFVSLPKNGTHTPEDYIVRCEAYGVPQMRHRVILLGVRRDYSHRFCDVLTPAERQVTVAEMLDGLPRIRSRMTSRNSDRVDTFDNWVGAIAGADRLLRNWDSKFSGRIVDLMRIAVDRARHLTDESESSRLRKNGIGTTVPVDLVRWIRRRAPTKAVQHEPRAHMASDLGRYLFASSYAVITGESPRLRHFPSLLLPDHLNAKGKNVPFSDRFRVQVAGQPSTTIVSHIAKDGHYYIHPDPSQCRSLTVREAARLQTFPDNYFFMGNRTQQYHQVGNAVPPYLAQQLGQIVARLLTGAAKSQGGAS